MEAQVVSGHLLLLCLPAWGHLRPLASFACKVVKERNDIAITFLTLGDFNNRVEREIGRYFSASAADSKAKANIRLVNIGGQGTEAFALVPHIYREFPGYYQKLMNSQPVQCFDKNKTIDAIIKPTAVVLDVGGSVSPVSPLFNLKNQFFLLEVLQQIRSVTGRSIPVWAWVSTSASSLLHILGPQEYGGFGDVEAKARIQAKETGRNVDDVIDEIYSASNGTVVTVPGVPPMYDYEWFPQETIAKISKGKLYATSYIFARECDGFVSVSSAAYDQKGLEAVRAWLGETNRPVYAIGPLIPPGFGDNQLSDTAKQMEIDSSTNGGEFQEFLDKTLTTHGKHSLIYVSFGSVWWPKTNEHVWILVDVLLELNYPFILSHASPHAVVPPGYAEKIKQSEIGLLSKWSPQQMVLNHPATGWFLTHCGQNSVTESLASGIPMIAWPLDADQPGIAASLTLTLDVAFQMVEIRTGKHGLKPLYRGAHPTGTDEAIAAEARRILQNARGSEGERKRRNAESLREKWSENWKEGGDALKDLRRLLTSCCPP